MQILTGTSDKIQVITSAAADIEVSASYMDCTTATGAMLPVRPAPQSITSATTTDVIPSPTSGHAFNVGGMQYRNSHASTSCDVTVQITDGTNVATMIKCTLLAGETLVFDRNGTWTHYDVNGGIYGGLPAATQADMEAATSLTTFVTPGRLHLHPGVAKFVAMTTGTATPALQTPPTYNVTSITDNGVGDLTVTIATDFSSANWCCQTEAEPISTTFTAIANVMRANIRFGGQAAGTIRCTSLDWSATTNVIRDPISWHICGFGDQ